MTTIVWDGQKLCADTLVVAEGQPKVHTKKLTKTEDGHLIGFCGSVRDAKRLLLWFHRGHVLKRLPELEACSLLIVTPQRQVITVDSDGTVCPLLDHRFAIGSGSAYALGALAMDASGPEAIEVAMRFDTSTGGDVQWLELDPDL